MMDDNLLACSMKTMQKVKKGVEAIKKTVVLLMANNANTIYLTVQVELLSWCEFRYCSS